MNSLNEIQTLKEELITQIKYLQQAIKQQKHGILNQKVFCYIERTEGIS